MFSNYAMVEGSLFALYLPYKGLTVTYDLVKAYYLLSVNRDAVDLPWCVQDMPQLIVRVGPIVSAALPGL